MRSIDLSEYRSKRRPTDIVFDSTGLKIFGEGDWKVAKHGLSKSKVWRKLHVGICPRSGEIIIAELTEASVADCKLLPTMLAKCPRSVKKAYGDGAYDTRACREALRLRGIETIIPPRKNGKPGMTEATAARDEALFIIAGFGNTETSRKIWKIASEYHKRSLVETGFSRWKRLLGDSLFNKRLDSQRSEVSIKSFILNKHL